MALVAFTILMKSISIFSLNTKMPIIYCLQNDSFKENILSIGITESQSTLNQFVATINKNFLPTPYTILFTSVVYTRIEIVYALLMKFGRHIYDSFFEIGPDTVEQLFALIQDENKIQHENNYRIVQEGTEYIIPKGEEVYTVPKPYYDRLFAYETPNTEEDVYANDTDVDDYVDIDL